VSPLSLLRAIATARAVLREAPAVVREVREGLQAVRKLVDLLGWSDEVAAPKPERHYRVNLDYCRLLQPPLGARTSCRCPVPDANGCDLRRQAGQARPQA